MRHLVRLDDWTAEQVRDVFDLADAYAQGRGPTVTGCAAMFFPPTSLRTRITFERGAQLMGLQPVLFPPETLDKPEARRDVVGYLSNWVDIAVVRHHDIAVLEDLASCDQLPIVNAMTSVNHPCEVLSDVYALAQQGDYRSLRYLFVGADGNIARAWQEIARVLGLDLVQCGPPDLATPGAAWTDDLDSAVRTADVILTDGVGPHADALAPFRVTAELLDLAPPGVRFAPCPPVRPGRGTVRGRARGQRPVRRVPLQEAAATDPPGRDGPLPRRGLGSPELRLERWRAAGAWSARTPPARSAPASWTRGCARRRPPPVRPWTPPTRPGRPGPSGTASRRSS